MLMSQHNNSVPGGAGAAEAGEREAAPGEGETARPGERGQAREDQRPPQPVRTGWKFQKPRPRTSGR